MAFLRFLLQTGRSDKPHSVDLFVETNAEIEKSSIGAACAMPNTYSQISIQIFEEI